MRIGIIGTGRIAKRFVPEALSAEGIALSGVYNPHPESARSFVRGLSGETQLNACPGPEELLENCDAVYIASPHETHYGYILKALSFGRHVLCEKPMVLRKTQAEESFRLAKEKRLVLMEGIKTAYCPGYRKLLETANSGIIGEIRYIQSCFTKLEDPGSRELTDRQFGGSFTELGSYILLPILELFGYEYDAIRFSTINNGIGLDVFTKAEFSRLEHMAAAICGLGVKAEGSLLIGETKGFIKAEAPWWKTTRFEVYFEDPDQMKTFDTPFAGDGLRYEIAEFRRLAEEAPESAESCIQAARERSICMVGIMERFLAGRTAA